MESTNSPLIPFNDTEMGISESLDSSLVNPNRYSFSNFSYKRL